jgi:hypothetical protein
VWQQGPRSLGRTVAAVVVVTSAVMNGPGEVVVRLG